MSEIKQYYDLKEKYASKYNKKRLRIIKDNILTKSEKTKQLTKLKNKEDRCLNCGKPGGMIFKHKDRVLIAKCNAISEKCDLNISVTLDNYISLIDLYTLVKKQLEITKFKILKKSNEKSLKDLTSSLQPNINKKFKINFLD